MTLFGHDWRRVALAIVLVAAGPLSVFASAVQRGSTGESVAGFVIMMLPPIWLIVLVTLALTSLDAGSSELDKGELGRLLDQKRQGILRDAPRVSWDHPIAPSVKPTPTVNPNPAPVLDQLLAWKHQSGRLSSDPKQQASDGSAEHVM